MTKENLQQSGSCKVTRTERVQDFRDLLASIIQRKCARSGGGERTNVSTCSQRLFNSNSAAAILGVSLQDTEAVMQ